MLISIILYSWDSLISYNTYGILYNIGGVEVNVELLMVLEWLFFIQLNWKRLGDWVDISGLAS
ncbi:hypothetical protein GFK82_00653 [Candidatus Steffania adelgidicola]|nr:hypothetical protein GFK82_00653 [Candidatus Steffania adelgidicola]